MGLMTSVSAAGVPDYPSRPIRFIVGSPPGGPGSIVARPLADKMSQMLGQPVVVDYVSGAAGLIAAGIVAKSNPDGYTVHQITTRFALAPSAYAKLPYDTMKDFAFISPLTTGHIVLVAAPKFAAKNVKELIALNRRQPGKMTFASSGAGTSLHLAGELMNVSAGTDMVHIPYRGAGPAMIDVISGQVDVMFIALPPALPPIQQGQLVPLGIASPARVESLPNVPTIIEQGLPGFIVYSRSGLIASAKTPRDIVTKLNTTLTQILSTKEMKERLASFGAEPMTGTPEEYARDIREEIAVWARAAKAAKLELQ